MRREITAATGIVITLACGPTVGLEMDTATATEASGSSAEQSEAGVSASSASDSESAPAATGGSSGPPVLDDDGSTGAVTDTCPTLVVETIDVALPSYRVVATDLDGDEAPDLVVSGSQSGDFGVLSNDGAGHFTPTATGSTLTTSWTWAAAADFDGDGAVDIAVLTVDGWVTPLWGDGSGGLTPGTSLLIEGAHGLQPLNVDGAGNTDLVVGLPTGIGVLKTFGDASFLLEQHAARPTRAAGSGDVDGDGLVDVLVAVDGPEIGVAFNDGMNGFVVETLISDHHVVNAALGRIDGDAELDLVFGDHNEAYYAAGIGGGEYGRPQLIHAESGWVGVELLDIDGSGTPEIAVAGDSIAIAFHVEGGFDTRIVPVDVPLAGRAKGDLDGDGRDELILGTSEEFLVIVRCAR